MSRAALIGLDWGTSSFRAFRLDAEGTPLERRAAARGILQVEGGAFEAVLLEQVGDWLAATPGLPVIASGMIGSRQGWVEAPYAPCPAGAAEIVRALARHVTAGGATIHFVPGLSCEGAHGVPDVMRGEETQILGLLAEQPEARLVVLPGTHSKWARLEQGRVVGFATFMTGELFSVLRKHSILGRLMQEDAEDPDAFARGTRYGLSKDSAAGGLLRRLFSARTLGLFGRLPAASLADYLSGLLIGSEIREAMGAVGEAAQGEPVRIVAGPELAARYRAALALAGLAALSVEGEPAARDHAALARAAGLVPEA
jgi:2-dehydro-3-deoxygalactonokinase